MSSNQDLVNITLENVDDVVIEIEDAFFDIPFENSDFQTDHFVLAAQLTPERMYRALGLRMFSKLQALRDAKYSRMREEVDLDEIEHKLQNDRISMFERRRLEIDKIQKLEQRAQTNKLINDAIHDLNRLYEKFKKMPKYTREEFEKAEEMHFELKLQRQLQGITGVKESLTNMRQDLKSMDTQIEVAMKQLEN